MTANGNFVQFCPMAKRFAFEIGSKFVFGALLNDDERQYTFEVCSYFYMFSLYNFVILYVFHPFERSDVPTIRQCRDSKGYGTRNARSR